MVFYWGHWVLGTLGLGRLGQYWGWGRGKGRGRGRGKQGGYSVYDVDFLWDVLDFVWFGARAGD